MWQAIGVALDRLRDIQRRKRWDRKRAAGRWGEDLAHRYLARQGLKIASRNFRLASGEGEADIVAWDGETLVFVEVKTRSSEEFGPPERGLTPEQHRRLLRVARNYSLKSTIPWKSVRFDTISVVLANPPKVEHSMGSLESSLWKQSAAA